MSAEKIYSLSHKPKTELKVNITNCQKDDFKFIEARVNPNLVFNVLSSRLNSLYVYKLNDYNTCSCSSIPQNLILCGFTSADWEYYIEEMQKIEREANDKVKQRWHILQSNPEVLRSVSYRSRMANFTPFTWCCTCDIGLVPYLGCLKELPCMFMMEKIQWLAALLYSCSVLVIAFLCGSLVDVTMALCYYVTKSRGKGKDNSVLPQNAEESWLVMNLFQRHPELDSSWIEDDIKKKMCALADELTKRVQSREEYQRSNNTLSIRAESCILSGSETAYSEYVAAEADKDLNINMYFLTARVDVNRTNSSSPEIVPASA